MPRRWSNFPLLLTYAAILISLAGCGYRNLLEPPAARQATRAGSSAGTLLSGAASSIRIAVLALRAESSEPWLDREVGDALRREFDLRGRFELVNDPARADYVLRGKILPVQLVGNSFSSFVVALEYKVTLSLVLELVRASGDIIRLSPRALSESDIYLASLDIEVSRTNKREAVRHLSDLLAVRVADSVEWIATPLDKADEADDSAEAEGVGISAVQERAGETPKEEGAGR